MKRLDYYWDSINFVSILLLPLSGFFCVLSKLRKKAYNIGVFASYKAPLPVIIIGNISVGGTGKTPLIIELVKQLQAMGKKPGVISRGYGGNASSWPQIVSQNTNAKKVGDEPQLIFQRTQCPLVVGPNRQQDIELLISQFDCDVVLSDDGLQHYALQRDLEIVVVDNKRQFGNGFCIPSGPLRESVSRLQSVDLVLLNGGSEEQAAFSMQATNCLSLNGLESIKLASFKGSKVHAVAGIGHPQRFFDMLNSFGIQVISHAFIDHHKFVQADFEFADSYPVLMTEKDAIKCHDFDLTNHWSVPIDIKLTDIAQAKLNILLK